MDLSLRFILFLNFVAVGVIHCDHHCGYIACPKIDAKKLTVHLVPHTHDDVGWVKTVDEYFKGAYVGDGVKTIIESVIGQLVLDPSRKFIWVETAFLWKWWTSHQNETLKNIVRKLVAEGQLEITGGAWSMNDEAVTHYQSTIDQFTWGFRRLNELFGDCGRPHVGWQIDPFGHSRETASLMAQLGFDGLFFGRLDQSDKNNRLKTKTAELIWRGSNNLESEADLFTGVLYNQYSPPRGFCFDKWCSDYVNDEEDSTRNNVKDKVRDFLEKAKTQSSHYATKNIIWTMGMDFHYTIAEKWYKNMDKLIKHVNEISEETGVVAVYSTPSCYLQALHASNLTWTTKDDDFFPYASEPHTYWTGYFTSRPNLKRFERQGNNLLQVCKQLHVFGELKESEHLNSLREAMGVLQHHDAITGTEKQYVADDYASILSDAIDNCDQKTSEVLNTLSRGDKNIEFKRCPLLNISMCDISENADLFTVTVYNPLAHKVSKFVRIPVVSAGLKVVDLSSGNQLEVQYVPIPKSVQNVPERSGDADLELIFEASNIPALGYKTYHVEREENKNLRFKQYSGPEKYTISNEHTIVKFDTVTQMLSSIKVDGHETDISQNLYYYKAGSRGDHDGSSGKPLRASGAYIFRPNSSMPEDIADELIGFSVYKGPLVEEVHQHFCNWASQIIRLYKGHKHIEIEWMVGPIPIKDKIGREVISWFSTGLDTRGKFTTDSNSREYLTRKRNARNTWKANILEPIAGNYYPITTAISMEDHDTFVAILTDRAQAGGSIFDGTLELMIHRRLVEDDGYGVDEVLNEMRDGEGIVTRGKHIVLAGSKKSDIKVQQRILAQQEMVLEPTLFFAETDLSPGEWRKKFVYKFSPLNTDLPLNVNILTLEPWKDGTILLRLEHILSKSDVKGTADPVEVKLQGLFGNAKIKSATEMSLGANQKLQDMHRFKWNEKESKGPEEVVNLRLAPERNNVSASDGFTVVLHPMQIRTFVLKIE